MLPRRATCYGELKNRVTRTQIAETRVADGRMQSKTDQSGQDTRGSRLARVLKCYYSAHTDELVDVALTYNTRNQ